jgi:hypothetical protein
MPGTAVFGTTQKLHSLKYPTIHAIRMPEVSSPEQHMLCLRLCVAFEKDLRLGHAAEAAHNVMGRALWGCLGLFLLASWLHVA